MPTSSPSNLPSAVPSSAPTSQPTALPSGVPTSKPTCAYYAFAASSATITSAASGVTSVYPLDVDGDSDVDVVVGSHKDDSVRWLQNNGAQPTPGFASNTITAGANGVKSVFALDVDGDSDVDVLSASNIDDTVAYYENDGSQGFSARVVTASADGASSVSAVDLDGDSDVDVLSAAPTDNTVTWHKNDGSQSFTATSVTASASGAYDVFVADVDGDADTDVLVASHGDDSVRWFANEGENTFGVYELDEYLVTNSADYAASVMAIDIDVDIRVAVDVLSLIHISEPTRPY